jgi:hypothetical protein
MNIWILVTLISTGGHVSISEQATYKDMSSCFEERDKVILDLGRPVVNYQSICVTHVGTIIK